MNLATTCLQVSVPGHNLSASSTESFIRSQATRTDENFFGAIHVSHQRAWCRGTLRLLKSQCDGTGESCQKARRKLGRGLMPNEQVTAGAKRAFHLQSFLDVDGCLDPPRTVNLIGHKKFFRHELQMFFRVRHHPVVVCPQNTVYPKFPVHRI